MVIIFIAAHLKMEPTKRLQISQNPKAPHTQIKNWKKTKNITILFVGLALISGFSFTKLRQYNAKAAIERPQYKKILVDNWERSQVNKENVNER